jgi:hypothetical protein
MAAAVVIAVGLPGLSPSVAMFGFMALVFTMRERVESSAEMVGRHELQGLIGVPVVSGSKHVLISACAQTL